jgi:hypothetical protein
MSDKRICKYCGMELSEDIPHGLRECHLYAVARIAELEDQLEDWTNNGWAEDYKARIAELEKDNTEFRQLIRDWSIVLDQNDEFQLWQVESVRQAMLEINKEREE